MSVKFFGQFLLERGVVSREKLMEALALQDTRNLRLGDYAIRRGLLTEAQADKVNRAQLTEDMRFGEIAVEMNFLTEQQVNELLTLQQNDYLLLGEALLEKKTVERAVLERELMAFKADQNQYLIDEVIFPPGVKDPSLLAIPVDLTAKMLNRIANVTSKIGEGTREVRPPVDRLISVSVTFSGDLHANYTLSVSKDIAKEVAIRILGDDSDIDDETVVDCLRELCNVICGNSAAKFAQAGKRVEIGPPWSGAPQLEGDDKFIVFPLHVASGAVEVRILR